MPKIEALIFKLRTIGFGKQSIWLHPFWITGLSHFPHLSCSFLRADCKSRGNPALMFSCLSVCLPAILPMPCSLSAPGRAGELRAGQGVLPEGAAEGRRELQSALSIGSGILPPGWLQQGPLLPERGKIPPANRYGKGSRDVALHWVLLYFFPWDIICPWLDYVDFHRDEYDSLFVLCWTPLQALVGSAARLQCPKINCCQGCSMTWKMTRLLECCQCGGDIASLSLCSLFLKKKAGWGKSIPQPLHFLILWEKAFSP